MINIVIDRLHKHPICLQVEQREEHFSAWALEGISALPPISPRRSHSSGFAAVRGSSMHIPNLGATAEVDGVCPRINKDSRSIIGQSLEMKGFTYSLFGAFSNPSRAWKIARLFAYWISPFWKFSRTLCFSPRKCRASNASACASVIGGISADRGWAENPVKYRRAYCTISRSGASDVEGW
jgi:hypothetical protein